MTVIELSEDIYWIGANIHTEDLFEGIWPIPNGVALNAYVVKGEKIALIELVREWGGAAQTLINNLESLSISFDDIDYIVLNHLEPDHTGFTNMLKLLAPNAEIVTTQKGAALVDGFFGITSNIKIVKTGDELDLGKGKKLKFAEIPNVHWPETMVTYEEDSKILFSSDAFGSFGVHKGCIFDDETPDSNKSYWEDEMLRYYANIVATFSPMVLKAIDTLAGLEIKMIAPSHGLVWRGNPGAVINKYIRYANYNKDYAEPEICVVWGSMYGNTETMLNAVLRGIAKEAVPIHLHRVPNVDPSFVLADAYKSAGLVIGAPTYEYGMFPPMKYNLELFQKKHIWYKKVAFFGSYGWSGGALKDFESLSERMKWEILDPLSFKGHPTSEELKQGEELGRKIASQVKNIPSKIKDEEF
ncbi:MAG: FprA family A-type flavoprotein [Candidatus Lokiarchaeota archaeon]|nr:FprA family A-type flavoprotein [Candidatus Lokiarchaeota archaeon]